MGGKTLYSTDALFLFVLRNVSSLNVYSKTQQKEVAFAVQYGQENKSVYFRQNLSCVITFPDVVLDLQQNKPNIV